MIWTRLCTREGGETGKGKRYFWQSTGARLGLRVLHHWSRLWCGDGAGALDGAGSSSQAANVRPLMVLALRPGTKCSASEGSIVAGRKEKI